MTKLKNVSLSKISKNMLILSVLFLICMFGCSKKDSEALENPNDLRSTKTTQKNIDAIQKIFAEDSKLGNIRNHHSEQKSLAKTVEIYTAGLDSLDFSDCPNDFTNAFKTHRDAWNACIPLFENHADLRGEMHDLFDKIRASTDANKLKPLYNEIMTTWADVENAAKKHNATPKEVSD